MIWLVRIWLLASIWIVVSGWVLSALHALNRTGYGVSFALAVLAGIVYGRRYASFQPDLIGRCLYRCRRRFRRPAPFLFLVLAVLTLMAGLLYEPFNLDSDAYRVPRILHWLDQEQWHWIRTLDIRMNMAAPNFEWLATPLVLFKGSDRYLFFINWISYLLLPGLVFSVFRWVGVRPRVAWWWMWFLASGWCFVFQASSLVNDSFAASYALAGVALAFQARRNQIPGDAQLALLAAAFVMGIKQTDLLLAALGLAALLPLIPLYRARPALTALAVVLSFFLAGGPIIVANLHYVGNWTGIPKDSIWSNCSLDSPFWGVVGNAFCLPIQNLLPPIFPWADHWNDLMTRFLQTPFGAHFRSFESFGALSKGNHGINERNACLGLGICLLCLVSWLALVWHRRQWENRRHFNQTPGLWLRILPWILLLIFMMKVGTYQNGRQLAAYYVFLFPLWLVSERHSHLIRQRWWQWTGLAVMFFTISLIIISRDRPLFPAQILSRELQKISPHTKSFSRIAESYSKTMQPLEEQRYFREKLPVDESVIGYATIGGSIEPGLWQSLGQRKVIRILPEDRVENWHVQGIHYVVLESLYLEFFQLDLDHWLKEHQAVIVNDYIGHPEDIKPRHTYLLKIKDAATSEPAAGQPATITEQRVETKP